ncbi:MAG: heavy-metal-associated domain-containing protein [Halobacteriaceae archaeon]
MTRTITVKGMSCGHCEQTVEEALERLEGVTSASADREADIVTIQGGADTAVIVDAVNDAGYDASA